VAQSHPTRIDTAQRSDYLRAIMDWNARLIELQRSIRVLGSVRWHDDVRRDFFARGGRELPRLARDDYFKSQAAPRARLADLRSLEVDIRARLGMGDAGARLLLRRIRGYAAALQLIDARGTQRFTHHSRALYGSSLGEPTRGRLMRLVSFLESQPKGNDPVCRSDPGPTSAPQHLAAPTAAAELSRRLQSHFANIPFSIRLAANLSSEASAGTNYLKLRSEARFSSEDIRLLEVHEGWAHLGTTFNGGRQPVLTILGKACPTATTTQEGLAVLTEIIAGACHPYRRTRLALRLRAVMMAEDGADFLDVHRFFLDRGNREQEAYRLAARVFRGTLSQGGTAFTKDLSYGLGLLALVDRLRALQPHDCTTVPLLFSGKTHLEELPDLADFHAAGLLVAGEFIPAPFGEREHVDKTVRELAF
jgi:uncharacterized protein (TIGR02421 family)